MGGKKGAEGMCTVQKDYLQVSRARWGCSVFSMLFWLFTFFYFIVYALAHLTMRSDERGRKKKDDKTNLKETNGEKDPLEGKVLDSSGNKILDRGTFKEFKICL
eukprot:3514227-Rhodomonas_salina.3